MTYTHMSLWVHLAPQIASPPPAQSLEDPKLSISLLNVPKPWFTMDIPRSSLWIPGLDGPRAQLCSYLSPTSLKKNSYELEKMNIHGSQHICRYCIHV